MGLKSVDEYDVGDSGLIKKKINTMSWFLK